MPINFQCIFQICGANATIFDAKILSIPATNLHSDECLDLQVTMEMDEITIYDELPIRQTSSVYRYTLKANDLSYNNPGKHSMIKHILSTVFVYIEEFIKSSLNTMDHELNSFIGSLVVFAFGAFETDFIEQFFKSFVGCELYQRYHGQQQMRHSSSIECDLLRSPCPQRFEVFSMFDTISSWLRLKLHVTTTHYVVNRNNLKKSCHNTVIKLTSFVRECALQKELSRALKQNKSNEECGNQIIFEYFVKIEATFTPAHQQLAELVQQIKDMDVKTTELLDLLQPEVGDIDTINIEAADYEQIAKLVPQIIYERIKSNQLQVLVESVSHMNNNNYEKLKQEDHLGLQRLLDFLQPDLGDIEIINFEAEDHKQIVELVVQILYERVKIKELKNLVQSVSGIKNLKLKEHLALQHLALKYQQIQIAEMAMKNIYARIQNKVLQVLVQSVFDLNIEDFEKLKRKENESETICMLPQSEDVHENDDESIATASFGNGNRPTYSCLRAIKFRVEDLDEIVKRLSAYMEVAEDFGQPPHLAAYILFMCIRYCVLENATGDVRDLFRMLLLHVVNMPKDSHAIGAHVRWLLNLLTLLNLIEQYNDAAEFAQSSAVQHNIQQFTDFGWFECYHASMEIINTLYRSLVEQVETVMEPCIEAAIFGNKQVPQVSGRPLDNALINHLEEFYQKLKNVGIDCCYSEQIFQQLMYFICAVAMNLLMLGNGICKWETGELVRSNLRCIEDWVQNKGMSDDVLKPLAPLNQVAYLLQARKCSEHIPSICDLCTELNTKQVLKVLQSYKFGDCDEEISNTFLEILTKKLDARTMIKCNEFTMDQMFVHPLKPLFKSCNIKLEDIDIPEQLE